MRELLQGTVSQENLAGTLRAVEAISAVLDVDAAPLKHELKPGVRYILELHEQEKCLVLAADQRVEISLAGSDEALRWSGDTIEKILPALKAANDEVKRAGVLVESLQTELEETNRGVLALYAELDERALKLRRADELKSKFLSYASHELRTPLNGIIGLARLLAVGQQDPEPRKQLEFIQRAAQEMREMVDDLLDLAKVEAGKITVHFSEVGLELVFGALRGMFRPLSNTEGVELHFEDTSAVPAIYTDEAKVLQILRNFLSNALKFTERGHVRVWAELSGTQNVRISVQDTGIGIDTKDQQTIFEEFAQIENPLQRRSKGTGLGLPLCKKLAELLGGAVMVESQPGRGSTFSLDLPLRTAPKEDGEVPSGRPFTVLHVEDNEIDRYLVQQLIRCGQEFQLIYALDGGAAVDIARRDRPDLILLDLNLPTMHGVEVLQNLRAHDATRSIPVAVLSSSSARELEHPALSQALTVISKEALTSAQALILEVTPQVALRIAREEPGL